MVRRNIVWVVDPAGAARRARPTANRTVPWEARISSESWTRPRRATRPRYGQLPRRMERKGGDPTLLTTARSGSVSELKRPVARETGLWPTW